MRTNTFADRLKEDIKGNIPIEDVAAALGMELTGTPPAGLCPTGHLRKSGRSFRLNVKENYFHCFGCGIGGDNIRLVQIVEFGARDEMQFNNTFLDALRWIIERFRPGDLDQLDRAAKKHPPQYDGKNNEYFTAAALYEKVFEYGRRLLYEREGKGALDYLLHGRGYDLETLNKTEWFYYPQDKEIREYLTKEFAGQGAADIIRNLHLQGYHGDLFRAALPWRDRRGLILGFYKRATVKEGVCGTAFDGKPFENQRQEYTAGLHTTDELFNLSFCRGKETVIIFEGPPDAAYISRLELGAGVGVAAVGQGALSQKHLDGLRALRIKKIIISFDNDEHGPGNTAAAIDLLRKSGGFDVFVINPPDLGAHKDPEELVTGGGLDTFKGLITGAASWYNWQYCRIKEKYPTNTDQGATAFHAELKKLMGQLDGLEWRQLKQSNGADFEPGADLDEIFNAIQDKKSKEQKETAVKNAILEYQRGENSLDDLRDQLAEIATKSHGGELARPVADRLRSKRDRDKEREPGQLLGYPLTRFKSIAEQIDGVQSGFYIFAGITHVGKTAFLTNIFYDLMDTNPNLHGIYFSLDDNENVIINRLLAIGCDGELKINELQKRVNGSNAETLSAAYDKLINWAETGRFNIMDFSQINTIETVENVLKSNLIDGREIFAVIDGLQNLETGKEYTGLRQKNVDLAAGIKRLVDVYKIPVFSSVEIRKRDTRETMPGIDDIMESGKWGYNASHIWIGHPADDYQNFIDRQKPEFELTVSVPKSKISDSPGNIKINVRRAYNQLTVIDKIDYTKSITGSGSIYKK